MASSSVIAKYHTVEREWYLWDGHDAIRDEHGAIRLFITAQDAYDWHAELDGGE